MKTTYILAIAIIAIVVVASVVVYWYNTNSSKPSNVLVVGTSPDFPPYESLDSSGRYTGFDVDLMNIIAGRLGMKVEWRDMAFDVLIGSLKQGKIDAIISAMSITSVRLQEVDFSVSYYQSEYAVLKRSDSAINITQPIDMTNYKIGTQSGSQQYEYLTQWINSSQLSQDKVFLYERFDQAVLDCVNGRVDIVFCEKPFALKMSKLQPVTTALIWPSASPGTGIALQKGDTRLNDINSVITDLNSTGILEALSVAWLSG